MRLRGRGWSTAATVVFLAGWSVLLAEPWALLGAAGIGGWLLAVQEGFGSDLDRTIPDLTVRHASVRGRVVAGETTPVAVTVEAARPTPVALAIEPGMPASVDAAVPTIELAPGEERAEAMIDVTWPVAGTVRLGPATVRATDRHACFRQAVPVGEDTLVTVEPRRPRNVHVGTGADPATASFGEHAADRLASGLEPAEVRKYVPGDAFRRIDWKATARLGEPHVQEFEGESERTTIVVFDHRSATGTGEPGRRALDYAREIALAFVEAARADADPLGAVTVGDEGLTGTYDPRAATAHYDTIRAHLAGVEPTAVDAEVQRATSPARAAQLADRLDDDTPFDRRLRPFVEQARAYVERVSDRPLFAAVRSATRRQASAAWLVIVTDDRARAELREAVEAARLASAGVLVFLTPSVLFETDGLADLDQAYERYVDFETFRQDLATRQDVWAFEVGPGDRLETLLAAGRAEQRSVETAGREP